MFPGYAEKTYVLFTPHSRIYIRKSKPSAHACEPGFVITSQKGYLTSHILSFFTSIRLFPAKRIVRTSAYMILHTAEGMSDLKEETIQPLSSLHHRDISPTPNNIIGALAPNPPRPVVEWSMTYLIRVAPRQERGEQRREHGLPTGFATMLEHIYAHAQGERGLGRGRNYLLLLLLLQLWVDGEQRKHERLQRRFEGRYKRLPTALDHPPYPIYRRRQKISFPLFLLLLVGSVHGARQTLERVVLALGRCRRSHRRCSQLHACHTRCWGFHWR